MKLQDIICSNPSDFETNDLINLYNAIQEELIKREK